MTHAVQSGGSPVGNGVNKCTYGHLTAAMTALISTMKSGISAAVWKIANRKCKAGLIALP